jgi:ribosomal protein S17E
VTKLKNAISGKVTRLIDREKELEVKEHLKKLLDMLNN